MMEKDNMIFCILRFMSDRTFTLFERGPYGPFKGKHPLIIFRVFFGSNIGNDSSIVCMVEGLEPFLQNF